MTHLSKYQRAKRAKAHIHEVNRLGWPDTEDGIRKLVSEMDPDERVVCWCGRFIKHWDGWHFKFPATTKVIEVLDSEVTGLIFAEDEED